MTRLQKLALTATTILAALMTTTAMAQYNNVRSGMLLGVYASPSQGGLGIHGFIPGYSAQTVLSQGDVLLRATADGVSMYPIRSLHDMENMKMSIGANRDTALEVYRPGVGLTYCWVTFTPIYGPAAATVNGQPQVKATFKSEAVKPGARSLFNRNGNSNTRPMPRPQTSHKIPGHTRPQGNSNAAQLFGR